MSACGCSEPVQKRFGRKKLYILVVVALLILAILVFHISVRWHTPDFDELLARAKLARLPGSIENLQVETRPDIEDGREIPNRRILFVQFQAEPNNIGDFIANSTSIDRNSFRSLTPLADRDQIPTWWLAGRSISGRSYFFEEKDINGIVAVSNNSGTVSIGAYYVVNPRMRDTQIFVENLKDDLEDFVDDLIHEVADILWD